VSASTPPTPAGAYGAETVRMARVAEPSSRPAPGGSSVAEVNGSASGASSSYSTATGSTVSSASAPAQSAPRTRRARLVLTRLDPWSVMKLSFLLAIALGIVTIVAVLVLWNILNSMGVFTSVADTYAELTSSEQGGSTDLMQYVGLSRVMGVTTILASVNVVLMTALATLAAFLYNITAALVGGLHVTLSEDG